MIRILEVRFEEIPVELRERIGRIDDLEILGMLLVQAVTAQSLDAFESAASQSVAEENEESSLGEGEEESE